MDGGAVMTGIQPDIRTTLPPAMVEAAARALWEWAEGEERRHERWLFIQEGTREHWREQARAVLAAALAECEVTEQGIVTGDPGLGYPAYHFVWPIPGGTGGGSGLADAAAFVTANRSQGRHPFPWRDGPHLHRRLLVLTPIEDVTAVDTPAQEETAK